MEAVNYAIAIGEDETEDNGFLKNAFHYQLHDRIQWGRLLCAVVGGGLTWLLRWRWFLGGWQCAGCMLLLTLLLLALMSLSESSPLFRGTGYYWYDGSAVVIQCGAQEYRIASVKEMIGGTRTFFFARCSTLSITTDRDIFEIFSIPLHAEEPFEQSSVYPLCQFVLRSFPCLEAVELPGQKTKHRYLKMDK